TAPSAGTSTVTPRTRTGGSRCSSSSPGSSTSASTSASPPTTAPCSRLPLASTAAGADRACATTSRGGWRSCGGTADGGPMTGERAVQLEGAAAALAAAALFGVSAPLAKMLLPGTGPLPLAAFLYLGAGLGLTGVGALARARAGPGSVPREARLRPDDLPLLAVVIAAGGIAGPVLMLLGLQRVSAVAGSLLLNLEAPLTILLAVALF